VASYLTARKEPKKLTRTMDPFAPPIPANNYISPAAPMLQPAAPFSANRTADPFLDILSRGAAPSPYATAPKSGARDSLGDLDPFTPSPTAAATAAAAAATPQQSQQSQRSQRAPMSNPFDDDEPPAMGTPLPLTTTTPSTTTLSPPSAAKETPSPSGNGANMSPFSDGGPEDDDDDPFGLSTAVSSRLTVTTTPAVSSAVSSQLASTPQQLNIFGSVAETPSSQPTPNASQPPRAPAASTPQQLDIFGSVVQAPTPPQPPQPQPAAAAAPFSAGAMDPSTDVEAFFSTSSPSVTTTPYSSSSASSNVTFDPFSDEVSPAPSSTSSPQGGGGGFETGTLSSDEDEDDGSGERRFSDPRLHAMYGGAVVSLPPPSSSSPPAGGAGGGASSAAAATTDEDAYGPKALGPAPSGMILVRSSARSMLVKDWRACFVTFVAPISYRADVATSSSTSSPSPTFSTSPAKTRLLVFRSPEDYERYLNLGSSPHREPERAQLVKRSVDVCYYHKCTPIKVKRYEGFAAMSRRASATNGSRQPPDPRPMEQQQQAAQAAVNTRGSNLVLTSNTGDLPHFTLEELTDYGSTTSLKFACTQRHEGSPERKLLGAFRQYLNDIIRNGRYERSHARPALPKSPFE
jgi:hypothetical protein